MWFALIDSWSESRCEIFLHPIVSRIFAVCSFVCSSQESEVASCAKILDHDSRQVKGKLIAEEKGLKSKWTENVKSFA